LIQSKKSGLPSSSRMEGDAISLSVSEVSSLLLTSLLYSLIRSI